MAGTPFIDQTVLRAALVGLEQKRAAIEQQIATVRKDLGSGGPRETAASGTRARKKRVLSLAARKRIAEATRRRWAAYRKAKAAGR